MRIVRWIMDEYGFESAGQLARVTLGAAAATALAWPAVLAAWAVAS